MTKTTTINIDADTARGIDDRRRDGETRSARLAQDLADYYALLDAGSRRARTVLSPAEGMLILDVQNGAHTAPVHWLGERLLNQVRDAITLDGLAEKHGVDAERLLNKLENLGDMASVALVDFADMAWDSKAWAEKNVPGPGPSNMAAIASFFKGQ